MAEIQVLKNDTEKLNNSIQTIRNESHTNGYNEGFALAKTKYPKKESEVLKQAFQGAKILFVDDEFRKSYSYQSSVNKIARLKEPLKISNQINFISNKENEIILNRIVEIGNLSKKEEKVLFENYQNIKETINASVAEKYKERIKLNDKKNADLRSVIEKTNDFTDAHSESICELLYVLSPHTKLTLAKKFITVGKKSLGVSSAKSSVIEESGLTMAMDALCHLLIESGVNSCSQLYHDYAQIVQFSEQELIGNQNIKKVMKLISAEMNTQSERTKTFTRDWAIDPNYIIRSKATVLAGIDLNKFYNITITRRELSKSGKAEINILVPNPEILSVYLDLEPNSVNEFLSTKLKDSEMKTLMKEEKDIAYSQAFRNGILEQAKESARKSLEILYSPILMNARDNYELKVTFTNDLKEGNGAVLLKG